ncbi:hypothetical protein O3P69_009057 [Scylla paramamosain]|uniref:Uncharacterized protein n=1 Tax=Scylla paramamosain TaxID=85552 RepID=A0AAW0TT04_SCYPA
MTQVTSDYIDVLNMMLVTPPHYCPELPLRAGRVTQLAARPWMLRGQEYSSGKAREVVCVIQDIDLESLTETRQR